jgi:hypothetical protein
LTPVSPLDLAQHWPRVERGLLEIIRITKEKWSPSHVKQHLWESKAQLFVCDDGFAVLQRLFEDWTSEPYLNVWAMWFEPGKAKDKRSELIAWLDAEAARIGCVTWKLGSPRKGWAALDECEIERIIWRRKK